MHTTATSHGTVTLNNATVLYTPDAAYVGPASFTYTVCDDGTTAGAPDPRCATGVVFLTVGAVLAPTIVDDSATTTVDTAVTIDVLANDTAAPALGTLDPTSLTIVTPPSTGTATVGATSITFTPAPGMTGTDRFDYRVCTTTAACGQARVILTVTPDHSPTAVADEYEAAENQPLHVSAPGILTNDTTPTKATSSTSASSPGSLTAR